MTLELIPLRGLGSLRFGMTPSEVREGLAEEEHYEDWMGGNVNICLTYRGLMLVFDSCNTHGPRKKSRFIEAQVMGREDVRLFGLPITGWKRSELVEHANAHGLAWRDGPERDLVLVEHALCVSFDEADRASFVAVWEPALRVVEASKVDAKRGTLRVRFAGDPVGGRFRCLRTDAISRLAGETVIEPAGRGPNEATFECEEGRSKLRRDDKLLPLEA